MFFFIPPDRQADNRINWRQTVVKYKTERTCVWEAVMNGVTFDYQCKHFTHCANIANVIAALRVGPQFRTDKTSCGDRRSNAQNSIYHEENNNRKSNGSFRWTVRVLYIYLSVYCTRVNHSNILIPLYFLKFYDLTHDPKVLIYWSTSRHLNLSLSQRMNFRRWACFSYWGEINRKTPAVYITILMYSFKSHECISNSLPIVQHFPPINLHLSLLALTYQEVTNVYFYYIW